MKIVNFGILSLCAAASVSQAAPVYVNDFEGGTPLADSGSIESVQSYAGLGGISGSMWHNTTGGSPQGTAGSTSTLFLNALPSHDNLLIEFDLLAINSWDGSSSGGGSIPEDRFNILVDTASVFLETIDYFVETDGTISASSSATSITHGTQLFSMTGDNSGWFDAAYQVSVEVAHTAATVDIGFFADGDGWQGGSNESWGIDNLRVSALSDAAVVPSPAALPLSVSALAGLGFIAWRRRKLAA